MQQGSAGTLTAVPAQGDDDEMGHGTAVASLIVANTGDGFGMAGFGGATHVISVKVDNHGLPEGAVPSGTVHVTEP